jgi:hypothetical protein
MGDGPYRHIAVPDEHSMTDEEAMAYFEEEYEKAIDASNNSTTTAERTMWGVKITIFQNA